MAFYTPAGNKIKIWNALTGDVKKIYSDVTPNEITAFSLDNLQKRILLGDSAGMIVLLNIINGAKIKVLPKHHAEVTSLMHVPDLTCFLSGAMDGKVNMTLDNEFGESELLRVFEIKDSIIT